MKSAAVPNKAKNRDKSGGTIPVRPSAVPNLLKTEEKPGVQIKIEDELYLKGGSVAGSSMK